MFSRHFVSQPLFHIVLSKHVTWNHLKHKYYPHLLSWLMAIILKPGFDLVVMPLAQKPIEQATKKEDEGSGF